MSPVRPPRRRRRFRWRTSSRYILEPGDTPFRIAEAYGLTLDELAAANRTNPAWDTFLVGQTIIIPTAP
ncbi:MAG: LysM peptidoglycan-binding domain-containing protein [Ilumatobacteraceae bacterium]